MSEQNSEELNFANDQAADLYNAIKNRKLLEAINCIIKDQNIINDPLIISGPSKGFRVMHVASMKNFKDLLRLIDIYQPDVNAEAEDGSQPLHIAALLGRKSTVEILLKSGANPNATFGQNVFSKYVEDEEWCSDFGEKMSLLAYAILYRKFDLAKILIKSHADLNLVSDKNKTLLMYALEIDAIIAGVQITDAVNDYFINNNLKEIFKRMHTKYKNFGNSSHFYWENKYKGSLLPDFIAHGVDLYETIKRDSDTLLLDMAAYLKSSSILRRILPLYTCTKESKALFCVTVPAFFHRNVEIELKCIELIHTDMVNRSVLGLSVSQEEIDLMRELSASDENIRMITENYVADKVIEDLKKFIIENEGESINCYDFIMQCLDDKKLKILVKENKWISVFQDKFKGSWYVKWFRGNILWKIKLVSERIEIFHRLEKVSGLRQAIPLPFEVVLDIVDDFDNKIYDNFVTAFDCGAKKEEFDWSNI